MSQVCGWPDYEAPYCWDDPPVCRRPAAVIIKFKGAEKGIPTCADCAEWVIRDAGDTATVEKIKED